MNTEERRANMLTDNDVQSIADALRGHTQSPGEKVSDNLTKMGVALCIMGIAWIGSSISEMKEQQIRMDEWRNMSMAQMKETKAFMSAPRFTFETFDASFSQKIQPVLTDIRDNHADVARLKELPEQVKQNYLDIQAIKNKLDIE